MVRQSDGTVYARIAGHRATPAGPLREKGTLHMQQAIRDAGRITALGIGIIGAIDAIIINTIVAGFHEMQRLMGGTVDSHGWLGLGFAILGLIGGAMAWWRPTWAAAVLAVSGIGFAVAVHWWALLATPQLLAAAMLALSDRSPQAQRSELPTPA